MPPRWIATLLAVVLGLAMFACSGSGQLDTEVEMIEDPGAVLTPVEPPTEEKQADSDGDRLPMQVQAVLIYYPAAGLDGLIGEPHEIFVTTAPGDRAKQILADLISGPITELALHAVPPGTQLRQVYVLDNGTAYIDFSSELKRGLTGGSAEELFAVYSIVNSVTLNIPEIERVGILINGKSIETLNGHLDLRRPLPPDPAFIVGRARQKIVDSGRRSVPASG